MNFLATAPTPPCSPASVGSGTALYSASVVPSSYSCQAYSWTAPRTGTATLTFQLRDDPGYWFVDDISVYNGGVQSVVNGGFESGSWSPGWSNDIPLCTTGPTAVVSSILPRSGSYSLKDGSIGCADKISQTFAIAISQTYIISFWVTGNGTGSGISAAVTIT